jgi:hypothetical protein
MSPIRLLYLAQIATGLWFAALASLLIGSVQQNVGVMIWSVPLSVGGGCVTMGFFLRKERLRYEALLGYSRDDDDDEEVERPLRSV